MQGKPEHDTGNTDSHVLYGATEGVSGRVFIEGLFA